MVAERLVPWWDPVLSLLGGAPAAAGPLGGRKDPEAGARLLWLACTGLSGTQGIGSEEVRLCLMVRGGSRLLLALGPTALAGGLVGGAGGGMLGATHKIKSKPGSERRARKRDT